MSVHESTYTALRAAVLVNPDATGWVITTELYRQLDYGGDHFTSADRAIHYGETPKELYQLPVALKPGAHHGWELI